MATAHISLEPNCQKQKKKTFWVKQKINFCFMLQSTTQELETPIFIIFRIKMQSNFTQPLTFMSSDM